MSIDRSIEAGRLVLDVGTQTSYDELAEHLRAGFSDPGFVPAAGVLIQTIKTRFNPNPGELRRAAGFFDELSRQRPTRIALVTGSVLHYGLGRMLQAYCDYRGIELRAFDDPLEAQAWLEST